MATESQWSGLLIVVIFFIQMATESQWSGLLIVVIFVAIFAIASVSTMAIYFFCKCHKKKKKGMQIRPSQNERSNADNEEETGMFFHSRDDGLHWITSEGETRRTSRSKQPTGRKRLDTPNVQGISETYMAPRNRRESLSQYLTIDEKSSEEMDEESIESVRRENLRYHNNRSFKETRRENVSKRQNQNETMQSPNLVSVVEEEGSFIDEITYNEQHPRSQHSHINKKSPRSLTIHSNPMYEDITNNEPNSYTQSSRSEINRHSFSDNQVNQRTLADNQISRHSITDNQISQHFVTDNQISRDSVTNNQISRDSVTNNQIRNHFVTDNQISRHSVMDNQMNQQLVTDNQLRANL